MTKLRREKKLIPQEQKGLGDKGRRRFDTRSTAVSEMSPTPTMRPALIFKALSPADSTGPLPSSFCSTNPHSRAKFQCGVSTCTHARGSIRKPTKEASKQAGRSGGSGTQVAAVFPLMQWPGATLTPSLGHAHVWAGNSLE